MTGNIHRLPVRVYYSDTDTGGVVYHSRYLDMAEHGRTELLRELGGNQRKMISDLKMVFVVRSLKIEYIKPGHLDDLLEVHTSITRCERFTVLFDQKIYRGDEEISALEVKVGSISMESGRPLAMPEQIRESLLGFHA